MNYGIRIAELDPRTGWLARQRNDGKQSERHRNFARQLAYVLFVIRKQGPEAGLQMARTRGLAGHAEVRKALLIHADKARQATAA